MKLTIEFKVSDDTGKYAAIEYADNNINNPVNSAQIFLNEIKKHGLKAFYLEAQP